MNKLKELKKKRLEDREKQTKEFLSKINKIETGETVFNNLIDLVSVIKKINDKYYQFSIQVYPTSSKKYEISIQKSPLENVYYNKQYIDTYPKKWYRIFEELEKYLSK